MIILCMQPTHHQPLLDCIHVSPTLEHLFSCVHQLCNYLQDDFEQFQSLFQSAPCLQSLQRQAHHIRRDN